MQRTAWALSAALAAVLATPASAATFVVTNGDAPGTGFNDPTPVAPVGGNTATTRGAQALAAFRHAADLWGASLDSPVSIEVLATFAPLSCSATGGIVGSATTGEYIKDSAGAPPGVWMPVALANRLAGVDLRPGQPDIIAQFNGAMGTSGCLQATSWYLGLDAQAGNGTDLVTIVLHELAHGLGVTTPADLTTGTLYAGSPDAFTRLLLDERTGLLWPQMTDAERMDSALDYQQLSFAGPEVAALAPTVLDKGVPTLALGAPLSVTPAIALAPYGPALPAAPLTATMVFVNDAVASPTDACEPIAAISGQIAFVEAGGCTDLTKVQNVQAGGAVAAVLVDDLLVPPPSPLTGSPAPGTVTIPAVRITQRDANALRPYLGSIASTLVFDAARLRGASPAGRVYLYATDPVQQGRSVTHWDPSATPDLLMEPVVRVGHGLDLTIALLHDIGWRPYRCGNGLVEGSEQCDPGADAGADAGCLPGCVLPGGRDGGALPDAASLDACSGAGCGGAPVDASSGGTTAAGGAGGAGGAASGGAFPFGTAKNPSGCACRLAHVGAGMGEMRGGAPFQDGRNSRRESPSVLLLAPLFLAIRRCRVRR